MLASDGFLEGEAYGLGMFLSMLLVAAVIFGVLLISGVAFLTLGIIVLKKNRKAGKSIVAPVISIVAGGIFLLPVVLAILWYLYSMIINGNPLNGKINL